MSIKVIKDRERLAWHRKIKRERRLRERERERERKCAREIYAMGRQCQCQQ